MAPLESFIHRAEVEPQRPFHSLLHLYKKLGLVSLMHVWAHRYRKEFQHLLSGVSLLVLAHFFERSKEMAREIWVCIA